MIELPVVPEKRAIMLTQEPPDILVDLLKVVAEPTRLRIIAVLKAGETCVCELVDALGLPQNSISHHLQILKRAGLVRERRDQRDARWIYYTLDLVTLNHLTTLFDGFFQIESTDERVPVCTDEEVL